MVNQYVAEANCVSLDLPTHQLCRDLLHSIFPLGVRSYASYVRRSKSGVTEETDVCFRDRSNCLHRNNVLGLHAFAASVIGHGRSA